jgi:integrase
VRLLVLTMQRRQEVAEMDWNEIDLQAKTWTLPAERAKNAEAHVVSLSPLALSQLRAMVPKRAGLVFTTSGKPMYRGSRRPSGPIHVGLLHQDRSFISVRDKSESLIESERSKTALNAMTRLALKYCAAIHMKELSLGDS